MPSMLLRVVSLLTFALATMAQAANAPMYYIDDTDPSITYVGPWMPLSRTFQPITWANADECYNGTFTVGQGYGYQDHGLQIPFTGSGIALFVAYNNRLGLNVSITLDNNFTTINWFILDTDYTTPTVTTYNATLYDIQDLDYGDHNLNIVIQDYRGNQSDMMFDFAAVTGTRPATSSKSSSKSGSSKIGAGIGGGLGALAVISAVILIILFSRRKSHQMPRKTPSQMELDLIDHDHKDPSLFHRATSSVTRPFRPRHNRQQSSFSQSANSPISPVKPAYSKFLGQKQQQHPWVKFDEEAAPE